MRLPADLAAKVDAVAEAELRSRNNAVTWLVSEALRSREVADLEGVSRG